jgi:quercetin dioxygenase-like cupin family protein
VRYFEVGPGGYTTHERHEHQHVVIALRGEGEVRLGGEWLPLRFGDVVFVASNDPHQFRALGDEPFGFLCIVDAERDRPVPL